MPWRSPVPWPKSQRAKSVFARRQPESGRANVGENWRPTDDTPRSSSGLTYLLVGIGFAMGCVASLVVELDFTGVPVTPNGFAILLVGLAGAFIWQGLRVRRDVRRFYAIDDDVVDLHTAELVARACDVQRLNEEHCIGALLSAHADVQRAAAYVLGKIGTRASLGALGKAGKRFFGDYELYVTASLAAKQIIARHHGPVPAFIEVNIAPQGPAAP